METKTGRFNFEQIKVWRIFFPLTWALFFVFNLGLSWRKTCDICICKFSRSAPISRNFNSQWSWVYTHFSTAQEKMIFSGGEWWWWKKTLENCEECSCVWWARKSDHGKPVFEDWTLILWSVHNGDIDNTESVCANLNQTDYHDRLKFLPEFKNRVMIGMASTTGSHFKLHTLWSKVLTNWMSIQYATNCNGFFKLQDACQKLYSPRHF